MTKTCRQCGTDDESKFYAYMRTVCKACHQAYQTLYRQKQDGKTVNKDKKYRLTKLYGLSATEYEAMLERFNWCCWACGLDPRTRLETPKTHQVLHVDHDHATGKVRGLLCNGCNRALGFLRDSPVRARQLAAYIEEHG